MTITPSSGNAAQAYKAPATVMVSSKMPSHSKIHKIVHHANNLNAITSPFVKRKFARRGSKTAAMLVMDCCGYSKNIPRDTIKYDFQRLVNSNASYERNAKADCPTHIIPISPAQQPVVNVAAAPGPSLRFPKFQLESSVSNSPKPVNSAELGGSQLLHQGEQLICPTDPPSIIEREEFSLSQDFSASLSISTSSFDWKNNIAH